MNIKDKERLTGKQEAVAAAFIKFGNQTEAYRSVYDCSRMKPVSVTRRAVEVFKNEKVKARVSQLQQQHAQALSAAVIEARRPNEELLAKVLYGALEVFLDWQDIAMADPNKIVRHRRINCRHCNGRDHLYQWEDKAEFTRALAAAIDTNNLREKMRPKQSALPLPTDEGGYGFAFNATPHPECPKCRGEGHGDVFITDTGLLGPRERKLYKGTRITKNGVEVLMHDQQEARVNMAKALGMLTEKLKIVDPEKPTEFPALPNDPTEASRVYAAWLKGEA